MKLPLKLPTVALVGTNGYGLKYIKELLKIHGESLYFLAAIDIFHTKSPAYSELRDLGVTLYSSLQEMYHSQKPDLVIISSPIHLHKEHALTALRNGSHILCEKPLCPLSSEVLEINQLAVELGKIVAVGYQDSFSDSTQAIKKDILKGVFGRPIKAKALVLWERTPEYYSRNNWAGSIQTPQGQLVLDSPANNANAHYLHQMFYMLGNQIGTCALPAQLEAECYRANNIENFDTCAIRAVTCEKVEVLFFASHAVQGHVGPFIEFTFEKGRLSTFGGSENRQFTWNDGKVTCYDNNSDGGVLQKIVQTLHAMAFKEDSLCPPRATLGQTMCIEMIYRSTIETHSFPEELVHRKSSSVYVKGLADVLKNSYNREALPSECGVTWARKSVHAEDLYPSK